MRLVTVNGEPTGATAWENSDVLPAGSVAVAVMNAWPSGGGLKLAVKLALPALLVVTFVSAPR